MKVFSISLLSVAQTAPPAATLLGTAQDLSSFSFYQRSSVGEFMAFFTKVRRSLLPPPPTDPPPPQTVAERTPANQPSSVEENNYKAHVFVTSGRTPGGPGLAGASRRVPTPPAASNPPQPS